LRHRAFARKKNSRSPDSLLQVMNTVRIK
jgi:hypothetical protein